MKIDKSRRIMFFVSLIGIVVVTLIMGTTFAYQTLVVDYKEGSDNDTIVEAGKLNVSYENDKKIDLKNMTLLPNYKTADYTEFTIKTNDTSYDVAYQINLNNLVYTDSMISENFKYTITLVENDEEFIIGAGDFSSLSGTEINLPFNMNTYRILGKGKNETLRLYLWLQENENSQSFEKGSFKGTIELVSLFSNEINETIYKTFKFYGNSIQEGNPSAENPVEIQNLGMIITDTTNKNYGKYEIALTLKSRNLFNIKADPVSKANAEYKLEGNSLTVVPTSDLITRVVYSFSVKKNTDYILSGDYEMYNYENYVGGSSMMIRTGANGGTVLESQTLYSTSGTLKNKINIVFNSGDYETLYLWFYYNSKNDGQQVNGESYAIYKNVQLEEGTVSTDYVEYIEPFITNIYVNEPIRKVNDDADYIDLINGKIIRNVGVLDKTNTLLLEESYSKLDVPKHENLGIYNIPYIKDSIISVCSYNDVCASNIKIETNK